MKPLETTVEEVLRNAIQSEIETRVYYQKMAERAGSDAVRKRMLQLADEELVHRAKMERKYRETLKTAPPAPAAVNIELPPDIRNLDLPRALQLSLERERDSESYYRFMAERAQNTQVRRAGARLPEGLGGRGGAGAPCSRWGRIDS